MDQAAKSLLFKASAIHTTSLVFFSLHLHNSIICLKITHGLKSKQLYSQKRHKQHHCALAGCDPSLKTDEWQQNKISCQTVPLVAQV